MTILDYVLSQPYLILDLFIFCITVISLFTAFAVMLIVYDSYEGGGEKLRKIYIILLLLPSFCFSYLSYVYFIENVSQDKMQRLINSGYITKEYSEVIIMIDDEKRECRGSSCKMGIIDYLKSINSDYPNISHSDINHAIRVAKSVDRYSENNKDRESIRNILKETIK